jgi:predicted RNase H-like HicB family nuclease
VGGITNLISFFSNDKLFQETEMRQLLLHADEDGYIIAECPSLQGCISQDKTKEEALANIKEAIELWIEDAEEHGEPIPADNRSDSPKY